MTINIKTIDITQKYSIMTFRIMTINIKTIGITPKNGITTFSIKTLRIMTLEAQRVGSCNPFLGKSNICK
jgi:hypothetical protein